MSHYDFLQSPSAWPSKAASVSREDSQVQNKPKIQKKTTHTNNKINTLKRLCAESKGWIYWMGTDEGREWTSN